MAKRMRYIFFDLDGTLVDSLGHHLRVYSYFMAKYGLEPDKKEFSQLLLGPRYMEIAKLLRKKYDLDPPVEELADEYMNLAAELYDGDYVHLRPDVEKTMDVLANAGYSFALVCNSEERVVRKYVDRHLGGRFEFMVFGDEVRRAKPEPEIYHIAVEEADVRPHKIIAVEDSVYGIEAATGAGVSAIGMAFDVPFSFLRLTQAKAVVTSFDELAFLILG